MVYELSPAATARMAARQQRYLLSMPDKIEQLAQLLSDWDQCADKNDCLNSVQAAVHRLCGSAGLYGCDDLLDAARNCASGLGQLDAPDSAAVRIILSPLIETMKQLESKADPCLGED
jgi:chemotaxis protein histidine kinase CheA